MSYFELESRLEKEPIQSDGRVCAPILSSAKRDESHSIGFITALVAFVDGLILLATGGTIYFYYIGWGNPTFWFYALGLVGCSTIVVAAFNQAGLYGIGLLCNPKDSLYKIFQILGITFLVFLAVAFALKISEQFSRVWVFSWFLSSFLLLVMERNIFCQFLGRWADAGWFSRKIIIVGCGKQTQRFLDQLNRAKEPWLRVAGIFDDRMERNGHPFLGLPVLGTVEDLLSYARKHPVDDIVINLPLNADERLIGIVRRLKELPVNVHLGSDLVSFLSLRPAYSTMGDVPLLGVSKKPLDGLRYVAKEIEDKILASLLLILLSPLMLLIALAIKLESEGPVLFRQNRYGFNNHTFRVFKFRSMVHRRPPENGVPQAKRNDPRVTRLGQFLRRTSLDELPQLLNVLNGTMSLIGPRPHPVELDDGYSKIIGGYFSRHRVKPGITGWAQVNGWRGETDIPEKMRARVEHDIFYIENWSLWFDLKILALTAFVFPFQKNAY